MDYCKPKDRVGTKDKSNLIYETDYSNFEAVCFGECIGIGNGIAFR